MGTWLRFLCLVCFTATFVVSAEGCGRSCSQRQYVMLDLSFGDAAPSGDCELTFTAASVARYEILASVKPGDSTTPNCVPQVNAPPLTSCLREPSDVFIQILDSDASRFANAIGSTTPDYRLQCGDTTIQTGTIDLGEREKCAE